jgi:hypothetical protein
MNPCSNFSGLEIIKLFLEMLSFSEIICFKCQKFKNYKGEQNTKIGENQCCLAFDFHYNNYFVFDGTSDLVLKLLV